MFIYFIYHLALIGYEFAENCQYDVSLVTTVNTISNNVLLKIKFNCTNEFNDISYLQHQVSLGFQPLLIVEEKVEDFVVRRSHKDVLLVDSIVFTSLTNKSLVSNEPCWILLLERSEAKIDEISVILKSNSIGENLDDISIKFAYGVNQTFPEMKIENPRKQCFSATNYSTVNDQEVDLWNKFNFQINCSYLQACIHPDIQLQSQFLFLESENILTAQYMLVNNKYFSRIPYTYEVYASNASQQEIYITEESSLLARLISPEIVAVNENNDNDWKQEIEVFPERIYVDFNECVLIKVELRIENLEKIVYQSSWQYNDLKLLISLSNDSAVKISQTHIVDEFDMTKTFYTKICNLVSIEDEKLKATTTEVNYYVHPKHSSCNESLEKSLVIVHACPPMRKVYFDVAGSKKESADYCSDESCFHYDKEFTPVFILADDVTLESKVFDEPYNLSVIGGGENIHNIVLYTKHEQYLYNVAGGSTLIWAGDNKGYRWLCASGSPCGGIIPDFPETPFYYLVLQFSNEGLEETYCEYKFNFTIKLHGMPPGGLYPSLFIVLICITIMVGLLVSLFFLEMKYPDIYIHVRQWFHEKKKSLHLRFQNKVGLRVASLTSNVSNSKRLSYESVVKEHSAKVLQWMDDTPIDTNNIDNNNYHNNINT